MTSSPSLFWKLVSSLWSHLTPQLPSLVNTFTGLHLPDPVLHPPCHCRRVPSLLLPRDHCWRSLKLCRLFHLQALPCSSTEPVPKPGFPLHSPLQSSHSQFYREPPFKLEWKDCHAECASSSSLFSSLSLWSCSQHIILLILIIWASRHCWMSFLSHVLC